MPAQERGLILFVDDKAESLTVLGALLQPHYHVRAANSGERALQLLQLDPLPSPILLDVMMPGPDGHAVLAPAPADPRCREVPDCLSRAKEIARSHRECLDGRGYPDGLVGEAIPLAAWLMAVADVFDALICPRVYKKAWCIEAAHDFIVGQRGRHFDPDVVDACVADFNASQAVAERRADAAAL
jgi:response regulator RpfG family c-di-GMP phosphodiesterase